MHHIPLFIVDIHLCAMTSNEIMNIKSAILSGLAKREGDGSLSASPEESSHTSSKILVHWDKLSYTFPKVSPDLVKKDSI
jgi:hypothetical protein